MFSSVATTVANVVLPELDNIIEDDEYCITFKDAACHMKIHEDHDVS